MYPKISIFTKFTVSKSQFGQNSQFQNLIFHKIHIFQAEIFWIKSGALPQCVLATFGWFSNSMEKVS